MSDYLTKSESSRKIFEKHWSINFHENLPGGSWEVSCGWADRLTDTTKLIVAFREKPNNLILNIFRHGEYFKEMVHKKN